MKKIVFSIAAIMIVAGVAGTVFFFPFPLNNQYTCLYHRMCQSHFSRMCPGKPAIAEKDRTTAAEALLHLYIRKYALVWWGSILLLFGAVYIISNYQLVEQKWHRRKGDNNRSDEYYGI